MDCQPGSQTKLERRCKFRVKDADGIELFKASYQHDLLLSKKQLKIIGSVKTPAKTE
jgi:hypothetical protein